MRGNYSGRPNFAWGVTNVVSPRAGFPVASFLPLLCPMIPLLRGLTVATSLLGGLLWMAVAFLGAFAFFVITAARRLAFFVCLFRLPLSFAFFEGLPS